MPTYTGGRTRKAIRNAVYTTRMRLQSAKTDEHRARISALLAKHEAELAACEPPKPPADWKKCRRCNRYKSPAEYRLARGNRVSTRCAACLDNKAARQRELDAAGKAAADAWRDPTAPVVRAKPGPKPDGLTAQLDGFARERKERTREILVLIARYEAVRDLPGPARAVAYDTLGLALKRHGWPVSDGVREWSWHRGLGEITTRRISWKWQPPADPHADPRRVAKDELTRAIDLVEMGD